MSVERKMQQELKDHFINVTRGKSMITKKLQSLGVDAYVQDPFILQLMKFHPSKTINPDNIEYLVIKPRLPYKTLSLYYKYKDSEIVDDVSYVACIKNLFGVFEKEKSFKSDIKAAFRSVVHHGAKYMYFVEHASPVNDQWIGNCSECGISTSMCVDHFNISYALIFDRYIEETKLNLMEIQIYEAENNELRLYDTELADHFRTFHDNLAQFRLLCKSCNSKFGSYGYCSKS